MVMKRKDKELLERAYRTRAGMQAILLQCVCAYPEIDYPESTKHAVECPAHYMIMAERAKNGGAGPCGDALEQLRQQQDANRVARNGGGS